MTMRGVYKNALLITTFVLSQIPFIFRGDKTRVDWYLLIEHSKRIDFAVLFYAYAVNFLILSYILHYKNGIDRRITRFILIVTSLDLIHLIILAKQGFGFAKIGVAILLLLGYDFIKKRINE